VILVSSSLQPEGLTLSRRGRETLLTPTLLEELTTESGKPRLKVARNMLLNERNLEDLGFSSFAEALDLGEKLFSYWRSFAEFMVLRKEYIGKGNPQEDVYFAVKCSKRGNDVYQRRIKTRLSWLNQEIPDKKFFEIKDFQVDKVVKSKLLWITLTYDSKLGSLKYAWENLGNDFNRFLSALRQKYGKITTLRVWESYDSGYPHVHVVMLFEEAQFTVFPYWSEKENKLTFRIKEKAQISELWHSHVDIQAISSLSALFTYVKKHQEKIILGLTGSIQDHGSDPTVGFDLENIKGLRTLFLCWIFRKRSFSVSGDFREKIHDLISTLHNSKMLNGQKDLDGAMIEEWVYTFLGIWSGSDLGIPSFIWTQKLEKEKIEQLLEGRR
jgi:hypothetical protein